MNHSEGEASQCVHQKIKIQTLLVGEVGLDKVKLRKIFFVPRVMWIFHVVPNCLLIVPGFTCQTEDF